MDRQLFNKSFIFKIVLINRIEAKNGRVGNKQSLSSTKTMTKLGGGMCSNQVFKNSGHLPKACSVESIKKKLKKNSWSLAREFGDILNYPGSIPHSPVWCISDTAVLEG